MSTWEGRESEPLQDEINRLNAKVEVLENRLTEALRRAESLGRRLEQDRSVAWLR